MNRRSIFGGLLALFGLGSAKIVAMVPVARPRYALMGVVRYGCPIEIREDGKAYAVMLADDDRPPEVTFTGKTTIEKLKALADEWHVREFPDKFLRFALSVHGYYESSWSWKMLLANGEVEYKLVLRKDMSATSRVDHIPAADWDKMLAGMSKRLCDRFPEELAKAEAVRERLEVKA